MAADTTLAASEKSFTELTGALADLTARRNQLQTALREHQERATRLEAEFANIEAGLAATDSGAPDLPALAAAVAEAQAALAEAESAAHAAEAAHRHAREEIDAARAPLSAAEKSVQRLETEAKTIGKLLAVESKNLWPPVMDAISVAEGYEKALGAALGRRSRCAGGRVGADALGRRGARSVRSASAGRRHGAVANM